jgi:hypothetical protein
MWPYRHVIESNRRKNSCEASNNQSSKGLNSQVGCSSDGNAAGKGGILNVFLNYITKLYDWSNFLRVLQNVISQFLFAIVILKQIQFW